MWVSVLVLGALGLGWYVVAPARLTEEETDVAEAVFRNQIQHFATGSDEFANQYVLRVFGRRPPADLLRRFEGHRPPVTGWGYWPDPRSVGFRITEFRRIDGDAAEVLATTDINGHTTSLTEYTLVRGAGAWIVVRDMSIWIE
jgi:hypothetical protein